ncbi:MAG TPA: glycosyltransferase family 4 protein [Longimicrobiales bacterium]|nr:glycosyltransferase family 4 protein [Longimicrobiales bacterium]
MKVLQIVTAYPRWPGDVITPWLVETLRRLRARGVDAQVLAPSYRGLGDHVFEGVPVHRFRYAPKRVEDLTHDQTAPDRVSEHPAYLGLLPGYLAAGSLAAARLARSGEFDVLHAHWPIPHAVPGLVGRAASGVPLVCSFYSVELTWVKRRMPFLRPFLRHVIRTSDAITAISSSTEAMVRELHDRPVERIPFGATVGPADVPALEDAPAPPDVGDVRDVGAPDRRPLRVLFVGRLVERKGVVHLIDAVARVSRERPVELHVIGDGPSRGGLEARARELDVAGIVRFHGFVASDELSRRFSESDVFVLPAVVDAKGDTEGLGVVLLEALAHGTPVVASAAGGIVDIVRDGETGLLVPPGDPGALAAALVRIQDEPGLAGRLVEGGQAHVRREFSWDVVVGRLEALYERLASQRHRS